MSTLLNILKTYTTPVDMQIVSNTDEELIVLTASNDTMVTLLESIPELTCEVKPYSWKVYFKAHDNPLVVKYHIENLLKGHIIEDIVTDEIVDRFYVLVRLKQQAHGVQKTLARASLSVEMPCEYQWEFVIKRKI